MQFFFSLLLNPMSFILPAVSKTACYDNN